MVYKDAMNAGDLAGFERTEPKHHRDAVRIDLRDGVVVYVVYAHTGTISEKEIWRLDFASTPVNLVRTLRNWQCVGLEVRSCTVGYPLVLQGYPPGYDNNEGNKPEFTTAANIVSLMPETIPLDFVSASLSGSEVA